MNTDCFTMGTVEGVDAPLPESVRPAGPVKLRFVRAAEGWRVALVEGPSLFVNQNHCRNASPLEAGDILRFAPAGPGMQFVLVPDRAEPLARLAARYAPQMLAAGTAATRRRLLAGAPGWDRFGAVPWWGWGLLGAAVALGVMWVGLRASSPSDAPSQTGAPAVSEAR